MSDVAFDIRRYLSSLANGLSFKEILEEMPDLEAEDILACLQFAAHKMDAYNAVNPW